MLSMKQLLIIVLLYVEANGDTFPYPGAFKPDEEVTFQEIRCVPGSGHSLQGLTAFVSVQKPGTDELFRYHTDPIGNDHLLHVRAPGGQLKVQWSFERQQPIIIELLQNGEVPVEKLATTLADIVRAQSPVQAGHSQRGLIMDSRIAECFFKTSHYNSQTYMKMEWTGDGLALAATYFEIVHFGQNQDEELIYRSEVSFASRGSPKYTWSPAFVENDIFGGRGMLRIDVYSADDENACFLLGGYTFSNKQKIKTGTIQIVGPENRAMGTMRLAGLKEIKIASLLKCIEDGLQLKFSVAIDFTQSNVHKRLHQFDANNQNQYTIALEAVGQVIAQYDNDKKFPAIGFGAKELPYLFYLNSDQDVTNTDVSAFEIDQIEGILGYYRRRVNQLYPRQLGGPTNFKDIIETFAKLADEEASQSAYQVLLIITDGEISDLRDTMAEIKKASNKALSIIIVGVGNNNFASMNALDADDGSLVKSGSKRARDIVQFVPMKKYLNRGNVFNNALKRKLAQEVLEELPEQILVYLDKKKGASLTRSVSKAFKALSFGSSSRSK